MVPCSLPIETLLVSRLDPICQYSSKKLKQLSLACKMVHYRLMSRLDNAEMCENRAKTPDIFPSNTHDDFSDFLSTPLANHGNPTTSDGQVPEIPETPNISCQNDDDTETNQDQDNGLINQDIENKKNVPMQSTKKRKRESNVKNPKRLEERIKESIKQKGLDMLYSAMSKDEDIIESKKIFEEKFNEVWKERTGMFQ